MMGFVKPSLVLRLGWGFDNIEPNICQLSGGATSNCGQQKTKSYNSGVAKSDLRISGLDETGMQTTTLGGNSNNLENTTFHGISGEVTDWTGSIMSEKMNISSDLKDLD